ncbi:MAG TPA: FecR domain-containing protein [Rhodanobacteraceae bacterium]|nr:FecR domain-containing protein [Rhodanobacteraceae bacterium]
MSRIRFFLPIRLLPAALSAALVVLGSATLANAQSYAQNAPYGQNAPEDQYAQTDPPDRVARLAYISGDVEFAPAGEDAWGSADVNRPLITGDRLLTGDGGRAALELGDAALRIDDASAFNFLDLDDTTTQVELSQGTLNLRVRRLHDDQVYEIDTPTVAFVANGPGTYRVDVAPSGHGAMVTVFEGAGTVYGENGVSRPVQAGQSYRFEDSTLANIAVQGLPAPDDFDRFCEERDFALCQFGFPPLRCRRRGGLRRSRSVR